MSELGKRMPLVLIGALVAAVEVCGAMESIVLDETASIDGSSHEEGVVWRSEPVAVDGPQSVRLSGWVECSSGEAWLRIVGDGASETAARTAPVREGDATRYVAVEFDIPGGAASVRAELVVRGEARVKRLVLVPLVRNLIMNPEFNPVPGDRRQRVQFWDEDRAFDLDPEFYLSDQRGGSHQVNLEGGRSGSALRMDVRRSWRAVRNIPADLPLGVAHYRLTGWVKADLAHANAPRPRVQIVWLDRYQRELSVTEALPAEQSGDWTRYEALDAHAPKGAEMATPRLVAYQSTVWFDDFDFRAVEPAVNHRPVVEVHVNQVGYESAWPKSAVVATSFMPSRAVDATLHVFTTNGRRVLTVPLVPTGRIHEGEASDWGAYYWRADFTGLREPGNYRAVARIGSARGESCVFEVGDGVLHRTTVPMGSEFFYVQRCGFDVPGWHRACHLDDARLPDGTHIDATGGWHSAGDYNKLMYENGDGGCAFALLDAYRAAPDALAAYDRDRDGIPDVVDEARWGADFVAKMQIPETGALRKDVRQGPGRQWHRWSPPEEHTDNIIGTDDDPVIDEGEGSSPLAIGAWIALSRMPGIDRRGYEAHARALWNHATSSDASGHSPFLLLASLAMYDATGEDSFIDYADACAEAILASQVSDGRLAGAFGAYGDYAAGAIARYALEHPERPARQAVVDAMERWVTFAVSTAENPFGLAKQSVGERDYFFEPTSTYGHNFEILARAWAGMLAYRLAGDERALRYAADQMDWVMGKNPRSLCMVEGVGTVNPPRYHHRYDTIPDRERGAVPGAIPNGFVRSVLGLDQPGFDLSGDRTIRRSPSYRTSEPWLVHNMWHLMAMAEAQRVTSGMR